MTVLVGTASGVIALHDGERQASELDGPVSALAAAPDGTCWGVLDRRTVVRRGLDGTWATIAAEVDALVTALHPTGFGALIGTGDARLWAVAPGKPATPVTGFDAVEGRDGWHAVGSAHPYVRSVTATADDAAQLASVHVGGIPRSTNGGASWTPTVDVEADVHEVRAHPSDPNRVTAAAAVGLLDSADGGATWREPVTTGLHATYLRAVACATDAIVVSASDGPFGDHVALYRRALEDPGFERCTTGLPAWLPAIVDTGSLDARDRCVAAGCADLVVRSDDGGLTWVTAARELPTVTGVAVLPAPNG